MTDASLAALLLGNRIVDVGQRPLTAGEFWALCERVGDVSRLFGMPAVDIARTASVSADEAERYAALLGAGTAFAFERERLAEEGVRLVSALDPEFPHRLRQRLGAACPSALLVAGPMELLECAAVGVVGSRQAGAEALDVAASVARAAAGHQRAVVVGLGGGVDRAALEAALDAGAPVVGVPSEGVRVMARRAEIRRPIHAGELCMVSPYSPTARFSAGNAMGRNKLIYALAEATLVVCAESGSGSTWQGAHEAVEHGYGRVVVWTGAGLGPGNVKLVQRGGVAADEVHHLMDVGGSEPGGAGGPERGSPVVPDAGAVTQPTLFE